MAILNYTDLERFMNRTFSEGEAQAAATIINALESQLGAMLNRPIQPIRVTEERHVLQPGQRQIFLRKAPVRSIIAFTIGMENQMVAQNLPDYDVYPWGIDNLYVSGMGYIALITYNAGMLDADSAALERVILFAAAREMSRVLIDAQGLERLKVEGTEYFFEQAGAGGFTDAEMKSLQRYKRRVIN
jgi:hypothetical protein